MLSCICVLCTPAGPQKWVWEEIKSIADMKFRFLEEEDSCDLVTRLASTMAWVQPEHLLVADYLHQQWQPDKVYMSREECRNLVYVVSRTQLSLGLASQVNMQKVM